MPSPAPPFPSAPLPRDPRQPASFDAVAESKRLLRVSRSGALCTLGDDGAPFASLVNVATDLDGAPLLLVSGLSRHTRQMAADPRVSLLLAASGKGDPAAHPRLTLLGRAEPAEEADLPRIRARFLTRHPKSELYADFPDFSFQRVVLSGGAINGGFARAADLEPGHLLTDMTGAQEIAEIWEGACAHLNEDHAGALEVYAHMAKAGPGRWRASGLDPEGLDLQSGDKTARLDFPARATSGAELRKILAEMARLGRAQDEAGGAED